MKDGKEYDPFDESKNFLQLKSQVGSGKGSCGKYLENLPAQMAAQTTDSTQRTQRCDTKAHGIKASLVGVVNGEKWAFKEEEIQVLQPAIVPGQNADQLYLQLAKVITAFSKSINAAEVESAGRFQKHAGEMQKAREEVALLEGDLVACKKKLDSTLDALDRYKVWQNTVKNVGGASKPFQQQQQVMPENFLLNNPGKIELAAFSTALVKGFDGNPGTNDYAAWPLMDGLSRLELTDAQEEGDTGSLMALRASLKDMMTSRCKWCGGFGHGAWRCHTQSRVAGPGTLANARHFIFATLQAIDLTTRGPRQMLGKRPRPNDGNNKDAENFGSMKKARVQEQTAKQKRATKFSAAPNHSLFNQCQ